MPTIILVDPICGMVVEPDTATITYTYAGWTYLFCCQECLDLFEQGTDACVAYLAHSRRAHVGISVSISARPGVPRWAEYRGDGLALEIRAMLSGGLDMLAL